MKPPVGSIVKSGHALFVVLGHECATRTFDLCRWGDEAVAIRRVDRSGTRRVWPSQCAKASQLTVVECACGEPATDRRYGDDAPLQMRDEMVCASCLSKLQEASLT